MSKHFNDEYPAHSGVGVSKEQTPITAEEFYLNNRGDLLRSNLGTKEFTIDMMEQYAQYREKKAVLEALEREFDILEKTYKYKFIGHHFKQRVKPKYEGK